MHRAIQLRVRCIRQENPGVELSSANLAYVIYTSGSTGLPKGVMIDRKSLQMQCLVISEKYQLNANDRVLQFSSFSFDQSIEQLLPSLLSGCSIYIRNEAIWSVDDLYEFIEKHQLTIANTPPIYWRSILDLNISTSELALQKSFRLFNFGGDKMFQFNRRKWLSSPFARAELVNSYGPTEATITTLTYDILGSVEEVLENIPIGRPLDNRSVFLLDDNLSLLPQGVLGELYIGGDGLARGYLNRGGLTAAKFIPNPFSDEGDRLYRTGDIVRYLADGNIEYIGRVDHQVKVRGFRIELGEIESSLLSHECVKESVVLARTESGDTRLVGYVVLSSELDTSELRDYLKDRLPDYMVPNVLMVVDEFPLTPNGKLDRNALPSPEPGVLTDAYVAPRTDIELTLSQIWSEVLGVERIGVNDNFFELGGHSLLATRVISALRQHFEIELPLRSLFESPTVAGLAVHVVDEQAQSRWLLAPPLSPVSREQALPLSYAQQRLWFLDQLEPGSAFYNMPVSVELLGRLDLSALRQTFSALVERHESLRTVFTMDAGEAVQQIRNITDVPLPLVDLSGLAAPERLLQSQLLAQSESVKPFNLSTGPLLRVQVLKLEDERHHLLLSLHHIVSDAWSMGVLLREVASLYASYCMDESPQLMPLPVQYVDYAVWQREWLQGEVLEAQLGYWREQLSDCPSLLELPTDRVRPAIQSYRGSTHTLKLDRSLTESINTLSQAQGVTLFMTLLSGFSVLLSRYSHQEDVCIGSPIANRTRSELEGLIGFFVNTLVLRTDLSGDPSFEVLLDRVKSMTLGAYEHQDVPFEHLVDALSVERDMSRSPLFQVMFALQNAPMGSIASSDIEMRGLPVEGVISKFDLTLNVVEEESGLSCRFEYNTDLFDGLTIERLSVHFEQLLRGLVADPSSRISEVEMLTQAERVQQLVEWNDTAVAYPSDKCIHELFEAQVKCNPDAVALVYAGSVLTYGELNARSNQLAHYLLGRGVVADELVGICMDRSLEMVIGILGVLKSGGGYVPIDPGYPRSRIGYMLSDSGVGLVLTGSDQAIDLIASDSSSSDSIECIELSNLGSGYSVENPGVELSSANIAYVIYTSGSTGLPKGVAVSHAGILNRLQWMQSEYGLSELDSVLQKTPFSFDVSVWEFLWPLMVGSRLVVLKPEGHKDPRYINEVIDTHRITTLHFVPSMLQSYLDNELLTDCRSLSCVLCSGEALGMSLVERFLARLDVPLHNLYGPTEASVDVTYWPALEMDGLPSIPIGKPISNISCYVLDGDQGLVPQGVLGELYLGGVGLARGYLNRGGLTAEKFIPNPFGGEGDRLYRTGDIVRYLADGNIEYIGRVDHQVKVRGFRIELGEIESSLLSHECVKESVVLARTESGDTRLVGYVVLSSELETSELRDYLKDRLPDYMVPNVLMVVDEFPLTPNGKLDRNALPSPEPGVLTDAYVAPRSDVELKLSQIWSEVLGVDRVGIHDNFFELGGHSLLAVKVIERMRQSDFAVDVRTLFSDPTLAGLSSSLSVGTYEPVVVPANGIPITGCTEITLSMLPLLDITEQELSVIVNSVRGGAESIQDIYPLSPMQTGLLFHHQLGQSGDVYLLLSSLRFDSRARIDRFVQAMESVIARHDILRTGIIWEGLSAPVQVVYREVKVPVYEVEMGSDELSGDIESRMRCRFDPGHYRLDIGKAPLLEMHIAQDDAQGDWVMVLLYHHIAIDHMSLEIIFEEMGLHLRGKEGDLLPSYPFRNYIAQSRFGVLESNHEAYFSELLGDIDEPTLPYGLYDVQGDGTGVLESSYGLDAALSCRIREQSRELGISTASVFHQAYAHVVSSVSGRTDVVFGTLLLGRMQGVLGSDRALGLLMNTLPVRIDVRGTDVRESLLSTHRLLTELLFHEHAPLSLAQGCSGVSSGVPLFSGLLNYRHSGGDFDVEGIEGIEFISSQERTNYPYSLNVDDMGEGFVLTALTDKSIDPSRVCMHMETVLESLMAALESEGGVGNREIEVLTQVERDQQLVEWNDTAVAYPRDKCVHELFEEQASICPDAVALVYAGSVLTYGELNARSNQLAHYLLDRGVVADGLVGICMDRSLEMVIGILGVLKSGGGYVPIDPGYPPSRIGYMLSDSGVGLVLTGTELDLSAMDLTALDSASCDSLECIELSTLSSGYSTENPGVELSSANIAYVIYTSGSTGQPKGVAIQHNSLVNYVAWAQSEYLDAPTGLCFALHSSLAFDLTVTSIFLPLISGEKIICCEINTALSTKELLDDTINCIKLTPSHLVLLNTDNYKLPQIKSFIVGGEDLKADVAKLAHKQFDSLVNIYNEYGPTEATVGCIKYVYDGKTECSGSIPIGSPISNTQCYILSSTLDIVPQGVLGELYLGGAGLARGYLNRGGLTAEKFIPNPFGSEGDRLYRTGDIVRYLADGNIEYIGRVDHQVKVRGFRIELGEIESCLLSHECVKESVVLARTESGDTRLVGYVVLSDEAEVSALRDYINNRLPDYMVPNVLMVVDEFPLTPNGKLDRNALPSPEPGVLTNAYVAPRSDVELKLSQIWSEVLGVDRVGIHDNFFELGGHSLLATRVISALRQHFEIELPLRSLFESPTVAGLAEHVVDEQTQARWLLAPPLSPVSREQALPLSYAQQRLWFLDQLEPGSAFYNMPVSVELLGRLDIKALRQTFSTLVKRHEPLRTVFTMNAGEAAQRIRTEITVPLPVIDLSGLAAPERLLQSQLLAQSESVKPFNLSTGPLLRVQVLKLEDERHHLLLSLHHIVSDAWSMGVLLREVASLYASYYMDESPQLMPLPVQYVDYAVWQREWLQGEVLEAQLGYWREQLSDCPSLLELPTDRMRPAVQSYRGSTCDFEINRDLTDELIGLSQSHGMTLFMTLLSGFSVLLSKYSHQEDVCIGSPIANRTRSELEGLIGFFVNTLVLRTDLSGDPSFEVLLDRVKSMTLGAYEHQDVPFEHLVDALSVERDMSRSPLFQVMFALQNAPMGSIASSDIEMRGLPVEGVISKFDLTLNVVEEDSGLNCRFEYNTDLFDGLTIERLSVHFEQLLRGLVADPSSRISEIEVLTQAERDQQLVEWNDTAVAYPRDKCVHELFEEQASICPDAVALVYAGSVLTYGELNARSNQLAHYLLGRGVVADGLVGICMDRSLEMVIGILGVLKSGGGYVPIDPGYPSSRIGYMLSDSGVGLVLTGSDQTVDLTVLNSEASSSLECIEISSISSTYSDTNPGIELSSSNIAYVIYTSGSTGLPKATLIPHVAVNRLVINTNYISLRAGDTIAHMSNVLFDASTFEIWTALINGLNLNIISHSTLLSLKAFVHYVSQHRVSNLFITTALFNHYVQYSPDIFGSFRHILFGGERVNTLRVHEVLENKRPNRLIHVYGPTENTTFTTWYEIKGSEKTTKTIPIGSPICNTQCYILSSALDIVPQGVLGELYLGGVGLARGYLNRGGLTAAKFIPNPFGGEGDRLYRTGDIVRYLADGNIEYIGRVDHQVKVRGFRIELGEIESSLLSHECVKESVVLARTESGDTRLVGYVVLSSELETSELRDYLKDRLPDYMVPNVLMVVDEFPLTPNGKLDRNALPSPEPGVLTDAYVAPRSDVELKLSQIWSEVLGVDRVGIHDNFFELGGHSLLAVKVIERMRQSDFAVDVRTLFSDPTLAGLSASLSVGTYEPVVVPANGIPITGCTEITLSMLPLLDITEQELSVIVNSVRGGAESIQDIYPLSPMQTGLLFHHQLGQSGDVYLLLSSLRFDSRARIDRFVQAMESVIARHDILRTGIIWEGLSAPVQVVYREVKVPVYEVEMGSDELSGDIESRMRCRFDPGHYRLDIGKAPLLEMHIAQDDAQGDWVMVLLYHHIAIDHMSLEIIFEEMGLHLRGKEGDLLPSYPFRNYIAQSRFGVLESNHEAYFSELLGDIDEPTLPYGLYDVQGDGTGVLESSYGLDAALSCRIREQSRELGISTASVFHQAYAHVVSSVSGRTDVVFGTLLLGRMQGVLGSDRALGLLMNTLPVRIDVRGTDVRESLLSTHRLLTELLFHEHAPLSLAQGCSGVSSGVPLFSGLLNYRHSGGDFDVEGIEGIEFISSQERTNYPYSLNVDDMGEGFVLTALTDKSIDPSRVCMHMETVLESLMAALESEGGVGNREIEVLTQVERDQQLVEWNDTAVAYPRDKCVHELFEEQASICPDAVALVYAGSVLTYGELNARSNQLAHYLLDRGVVADELVGICMDRSLEMVIGILGVLKSGGGYVPIDPGYPPSRIGYMLSDSGVGLVLTGTGLDLSAMDLTASDSASSDSLECIELSNLGSVYSVENPGVELSSANIAYVIYTSGSTGQPKGIWISHRSISRLIFSDYIKFNKNQNILCAASLSFDASTFEIWGALLHGAQLFLFSERIPSPESIASVLMKRPIKTMWLTASLFNVLIESNPKSLIKIEQLLVGGEVLSAKHIIQAYKYLTVTQIFNGYGPSETTTFANIFPIPRSLDTLNVPIGSPISNTQCYILSSTLDIVPQGVLGELYLGGAGLARGYLNRGGLTAAKFIPNPFGGEGDRLYRTGDIVRYLADGNIEYIGRVDHQVKVRGFRIELGEIESSLLSHEYVKESVVLARTESGDTRLVGYVVLSSELETSELRDYLKDRLPDYMVPNVLMVVDEFPLTPNGKLDRNALPSPEPGVLTDAYVAPRTDIELTLSRIWSEVLGVERIGVNDNFFELGGHSLLATRVISALRQHFEIELPLRSLFESPTVAGLAVNMWLTNKPSHAGY